VLSRLVTVFEIRIGKEVDKREKDRTSMGEAREQFTMVADEFIERRLECGGGLLALALLQKRDKLLHRGLFLGREIRNDLCKSLSFHTVPIIQCISQRLGGRNPAKRTTPDLQRLGSGSVSDLPTTRQSGGREHVRRFSDRTLLRIQIPAGLKQNLGGVGTRLVLFEIP
jgi:hypothetical protein